MFFFFQILGSLSVSLWGFIYGKRACFLRPILGRENNFEVPEVALQLVILMRQGAEGGDGGVVSVAVARV